MTESPTDPPRADCVDVVVIGAGLIGLGIAWRLSQRNLAVVIVDPAPASAASHVAAGMLAPVSEVTYGEEPLLRLSMASWQRYRSFAEELEAASGQAVGLRRDGTLVAATDAGDHAMLRDLHAFQTSLGLTATLLTSRECRDLEPMLSPAVRSGLLVSSDHSVDNRRLAAALLIAVRRAGVNLVARSVTEVTVADGSTAGVVLDDARRITAATVVVAAGPWSAGLAGIPASARPPVRPVKGQILRLHAPAGMPLPTRSIRALVNGSGIYLVPRTSGELVVGATVEDMGFDTTVHAGAVRELLRDAHAAVPLVDELILDEAIAGLRPGTPDNLPIIGATGVDGLIVASGHHRNGVLLTPLTADLIAGLVVGEADETGLLDVVSPQRFSHLQVPA